MPYLIDSDHIIRVMNDDAKYAAKLDALARDGLAVSVISYLEAYQGAISDKYPQQAVEKLDGFVAGTALLPVTPEIARRCAYLRNHLTKQGRSLRPRAYDLLIASTALEHGLTLVTNNIKDYVDIPRLKLYKESPATP